MSENDDMNDLIRQATGRSQRDALRESLVDAARRHTAAVAAGEEDETDHIEEDQAA